MWLLKFILNPKVLMWGSIVLIIGYFLYSWHYNVIDTLEDSKTKLETKLSKEEKLISQLNQQLKEVNDQLSISEFECKYSQGVDDEEVFKPNATIDSLIF